jgi:hypothetical protein
MRVRTAVPCSELPALAEKMLYVDDTPGGASRITFQMS